MEDIETEELRSYCVYLVTCLVNGKQYCGQTGNTVSKRWVSHKSEARKGKDLLFYRAIRKHGENKFIVSTLREGLTKKEADEEEKLVIRLFGLMEDEFGYNLMEGGSSGRPNAATRKKMSEKAPARRHDLSTEEIVYLYRSGLSMTQIGEKLNSGYRTIGKRLLSAKEPIRSTSETLILRTGPKASEEEINQMYLGGLDSSQIAEKLDVHPTTIRKRLHESGTMRTRSEAQTLRRGVLDDGEVVKLYREGMSLLQIAKKFGVSHPAIRYRLQKVGEPRRSISEASVLARRAKKLLYPAKIVV